MDAAGRTPYNQRQRNDGILSPMHDLKSIRDDSDAFDRGLARRGLAPLAQEILALDAARRSAQTELQGLQGRRNDLSRQIGQAKAKGDSAESLMAEVAAAIVTPPDAISMCGLAIPLCLLYEISIWSCRWVERQKAKQAATPGV